MAAARLWHQGVTAADGGRTHRRCNGGGRRRRGHGGGAGGGWLGSLPGVHWFDHDFFDAGDESVSLFQGWSGCQSSHDLPSQLLSLRPALHHDWISLNKVDNKYLVSPDFNTRDSGNGSDQCF
jgi:hypothetical protein